MWFKAACIVSEGSPMKLGALAAIVVITNAWTPFLAAQSTEGSGAPAAQPVRGGVEGVAMPDPKQMSGIPLPTPDVPAGTITVRLIKGSLSNPITDHPVELHGGGTPLKSTTNEVGRAEFTKLAAGSRVKAIALVGTERLESQEFAVPSAGGIRVMLVAADPQAAKRVDEDRRLAQGPAEPGEVVLGDQSRFVFELNDDGMSVFNILQILNTARTPVEPSQPIVFDLPEDAEGTALLEGSSPQATLVDRRITVQGPFAPGVTLVQFAYSLDYSGATLSVEQRLPAQLTELNLLAQKVGDMRLTSPQVAGQREMSAQGENYIVAQGPAIGTGDALSVTFNGLPHTPLWPRNVALGLAVLIVAMGTWGSLRRVRGAAVADDRRKLLQARRERLFSELTSLEEQHRTGSIEPERYSSSRHDLVRALERIYAELDEEAAA
jgi:hypothetical protein